MFVYLCIILNMEGNPMQGLIDKLCDHLTIDRIKLLIQNGFDDWETICLLKGPQLVELHFLPQQCIAIMVAINSHAKQLNQTTVFPQQLMQQILAMAKQNQKRILEQAEDERNEKKQKQSKEIAVIEQQVFKEFPAKPMTEAILLKGVTLRGKERVPLKQVTLLSLEDKEVTQLCELQRVPNLINLHLGHNHISKLEGLSYLKKLKILKLQSNQIIRIQGLEGLDQLQKLILNDNHISRLEGLTRNPALHFLNISGQRSKRTLGFDEDSCMALGYCLETLVCDGNRVADITSLKYLKVINTLSLRNNSVSEMGELSEPLGAMQRLRSLDFRGNPLCSLPKYRDYMVILSKNLQQLDSKNILPKQREYLVKLYSLKHAKQQREQHQAQKKP